jgi:hypothetical protein
LTKAAITFEEGNQTATRKLSGSTRPGERPSAKGEFVIAGQVQLEDKDACSDDLPLRAFAFDDRGGLIGSSEIAGDGSFAIQAAIREPLGVEVMVGPAVDADLVRQAQPPTQRFTAQDWVRTDAGFQLRPKFALPKRIWWPWWPVRVCVRGRVRKAQEGRDPCPVPFAQVEVFDVDREGCLWPILQPRLPRLFDKPVIRIPDLLRLPPYPEPDPIGPIANSLTGRLEAAGLNPQPLPPREFAAGAQLSQPALQVPAADHRRRVE